MGRTFHEQLPGRNEALTPKYARGVPGLRCAATIGTRVTRLAIGRVEAIHQAPLGSCAVVCAPALISALRRTIASCGRTVTTARPTCHAYASEFGLAGTLVVSCASITQLLKIASRRSPTGAGTGSARGRATTGARGTACTAARPAIAVVSRSATERTCTKNSK